jgi:5-methyltetrahydrofolate--homocysteine methyltransferase
MGSNLRKAGMPVGVCPELWALEHPDPVFSLLRAYVVAGSDIIYAPTFGANRISLSGFGLEDRLEELNAGLVRLALDAADGRALVAGDVTTTGRLLEPRGDMSYSELFDVYAEQISALARGGADLIAIETMMALDETMIALEAARSVCDLAVTCTLTPEADGRLMYGGTVAEAVETLQEMGAAALGVNCSVGPGQLESVVSAVNAVATVPVIVKPNAGMPFMDEHGIAHYDMPSAEFTRSMQRLLWRGARILGGCCGTDPEYIRALCAAVR